MSVVTRFHAGLAGQLAHPRGVRGRVVGKLLNRGNRGIVLAAVEATGARAGETVADIGFGGGLSLPPLLDAVGTDGRVIGVDIAASMIRGAAGRHREAVTQGRLVLHQAAMADLPMPAGSVDAAMTVHTLYFVADLASSLAALARVLVPGGRLAVGLGDPVGMRRIPATRYGFRLRPIPEIVSGLEASGFTIVDHRRLGTDELAQHLLVAHRRQ
jgi:arsenite methyltransferase